MIDYLELTTRIYDDGPVWVRLYNGVVICLVDVLDKDTFKAKFIPCSANAREYKIAYTEVREYYDRNSTAKKYVGTSHG